MSTARTEHLQSIQVYPIWEGKRPPVNEITYKCGHCLTNYVEGEDGTCQECKKDLEELNERKIQ